MSQKLSLSAMMTVALALIAAVTLPSCNPSNAINPEPVDKDFQLLATIIDALGQQG